MAEIALVVTSPSIDSQSAASAWHYAQAVVQSEHNLTGVFFYAAGVSNANRFQTVLADELALYAKWCDLATQHNVDLFVCVTAANRRGLQSDLDAQHNQVTDQFNIEAPFQSVGLGELVSLMNSADRMVQF